MQDIGGTGWPSSTELSRISSSKPGFENTKTILSGSLPVFRRLIVTWPGRDRSNGLHPDGKDEAVTARAGEDRFLMIKMPPAPPVPPVVLAEHRFTELRAKVRP